MKQMETYEYILSSRKQVQDYKVIFTGYDYSLEIPKSINNKYKNIYESKRLQESNKVFTARLQDINISCFDRNGVDGACIRTENNIILTDISPFWNESLGFRDSYYPVEEPCLYICQKWGGWNYFHFLHTSLPKLALAIDLGISFQRIVCNDYNKRFIREIFDLLNVHSSSILPMTRYHELMIHDLHVISPIGYGVNPNKISSFYLKKLFKDYLSNDKGRRLYVSRSGSRSIENEEEVISCLKDYKFEILKCEEMTVKDQIKYFSEAEVVIAPHGAGLSNIVFCKKGTKILELFSPTYLGLCYWLLGDSCELDLYYLIGKGDCIEEGDYWYSDGEKNMNIDINELRQTLELMEIK
ncbi:MAG: glycosyltransferase family 61 protein [Bacteroidales bacterium]|nr:glycosyltransferase family 61 protein [Bacteroidales bacterium]